MRPLFYDLVHDPRLEDYDLSSIETLCYAGAAMTSALVDACVRAIADSKKSIRPIAVSAGVAQDVPPTRTTQIRPPARLSAFANAERIP